MEVVVDSHALLWYLSKNKKLSKKASKVLTGASKIIVSTIVLLELLYILQKFGQERKFSKLIGSLNSDKFLIYPIDLFLVKKCAKLNKKLEMHDRLIVATAIIMGVPLVTKDEEVSKIYSKIIW